MTRRKGLLIVVSGPSGVGKTTLIERFLEEDEKSRFSISYTTRKQRADEIDGRDYHFVDSETFRGMIEGGCFLEWESVHGHLYGTPKKEILNALEEGTDIFLDIDVNGALRVKGQYPDACLIFVEPPSKEALRRRLSRRGEAEIDLRMKRVEEEFEKKPLFDYTLVNDKLDKAYSRFEGIVKSVRRKIMARITVEDCMDLVENRFELVHLASKRSKQLIKGMKPLVKSSNREIVTSLREIAAKMVYFDKKDILDTKDTPYQVTNFAP